MKRLFLEKREQEFREFSMLKNELRKAMKESLVSSLEQEALIQKFYKHWVLAIYFVDMMSSIREHVEQKKAYQLKVERVDSSNGAHGVDVDVSDEEQGGDAIEGQDLCRPREVSLGDVVSFVIQASQIVFQILWEKHRQASGRRRGKGLRDVQAEVLVEEETLEAFQDRY